MRVTIAMVDGEPTPVFWRVQDLREALEAAYDVRLPLTSPRSRTSSSAYCPPASRRTRATGDQALLGDGGALCRGRIPPYP